MATRKKSKKKTAPRKSRKRSTDSTLVFELLTRIDEHVRAVSIGQTAMREAIERFDRTVATCIEHPLVKVTLDPIAPAVASVAAAGGAMGAAGVPQESVFVASEPTDAELLS